jgi:hypothetical protein
LISVILAAAQPATAQDEDSAPSAGAASDPTAAVNFQDFRFRYLDLGGGNLRRWYNTEGGYMLSPKLKLINELHYWNTNVSGSNESSLESLHIKAIYLMPGPSIGAVRSRFAFGLEWVKELGDASEGTSFGSDLISPFAGFGWQLSPNATLITLVQYFASYKEEAGVEEVSRTGPRIIYIHSFPSHNMWLRLDDKFVIDHKAGNATSNTFEVQLGKMLNSKIGVYMDALYQTGGFQQYDWGVGLGLRLMY